MAGHFEGFAEGADADDIEQNEEPVTNKMDNPNTIIFFMEHFLLVNNV